VHGADAQAGVHVALPHQLGGANLVLVEAHAHIRALRQGAGY
jgi:hypothetical protein